MTVRNCSQKLIQIMPNMPDVHSNLANILFVKGDIDGAISHFQTASTLNPKKQWTSVINQTLGFVYQESKKDLHPSYYFLSERIFADSRSY